MVTEERVSPTKAFILRQETAAVALFTKEYRADRIHGRHGDAKAVGTRRLVSLHGIIGGMRVGEPQFCNTTTTTTSTSNDPGSDGDGFSRNRERALRGAATVLF